MSRATAIHPCPVPPRALVALGAPDEVVIIPCEDCGGEGFTRWLVRTKCRGCDSAGNIELRIVAARPEWTALYAAEELGEAGGWFVLRSGAERRELGWCQTIEQARAGEWYYGAIDPKPAVLAALGIPPGGAL